MVFKLPFVRKPIIFLTIEMNCVPLCRRICFKSNHLFENANLLTFNSVKYVIKYLKVTHKYRFFLTLQGVTLKGILCD